MADFKIPSFLENQGVDDIHRRMMQNLPSDIDTSEGSHVWNLTMPAAYEKAYMAEYLLTEAIKLIFPAYSGGYDDIMDYHAQTRGLVRKPAEYATGTITITGTAGTNIPVASVFSTMGVNGMPSIDFKTTEAATIPAGGSVNVAIIAEDAGTAGNVAANTIIVNSSNIDNISTVTNSSALTGGIEQETTEELQARILEYDENTEYSYGGAPSDYRRWALSVSGTGEAIIVQPTDDTDPIQIVLTDSTGQPASLELRTAVYNKIMSPTDESKRLAPINAHISVIAPTTITLTVTATVELTSGNTVAQAKAEFVELMKQYALEASRDGEVKYSKVGAILSSVSTISDYGSLTVNSGTVNIELDEDEIPTITANDVTFTEGSV